MRKELAALANTLLTARSSAHQSELRIGATHTAPSVYYTIYSHPYRQLAVGIVGPDRRSQKKPLKEFLTIPIFHLSPPRPNPPLMFVRIVSGIAETGWLET